MRLDSFGGAVAVWPLSGRAQHAHKIWIARVIFILTFATICWLLSNYQIVFVQPESPFRRDSMMRLLSHSNASPFTQFLNWQLWETEPRVTRPLSNLMDVFDTYFRYWLFKRSFPHPSVSLTWIFTLLLSPIFLYRVLALLNISEFNRWLGVSLYMSLPGPLSVLTMSFRSGKAICCFLFIFLAFLTLKHLRSGEAGRHIRGAVVIPIVYFFSLFFDEIGIFGFPLVLSLLFIAGKLRENAGLLAGMIIATAAYLAGSAYMMPILEAAAGYPIPHTFALQALFSDIVTFRAPMDVYFQLAAYLRDNIWIVVTQLTSASLLFDDRLRAEMLVPVAAAIFACTLLIARPTTDDGMEPDRSTLGFSLLFIAALAYHSLLIYLTGHKVWDIYWYGIFICLPWTLLVITFLQRRLAGIPQEYVVSAGLISLLVAGNLLTFIPINYAYKDFHYYPNRSQYISYIFRHNMYELTRDRFNRFDLLGETRRVMKQLDRSQVKNVPAELDYLIRETNYCAEAPRVVWHDDLLDFTCVSQFIAELAKNIITIRDAARPTLGAAADYIGVYDHGEGPTAYATFEPGAGLVFVNSRGDRSIARIEADNSLVAPEWNTTAKLSADGNIVLWGNGSRWIRSTPR
jgi:hypothetical protein